MAAALPFYRRFLEALGFTGHEIVEEPSGVRWENFRFSHNHPPSQYFALTEEVGHVANNNCVAFHAESRDDVDRVADIVRDAGALDIEGPCVCPEYSNHYYAVFFRDPSGNRLEVCHLGQG